MTRFLLSTAVGLLAAMAHAQTATTVQTPGTTVVVQPAPAGVQVEGRVLRTAPDRFVVVDSAAREHTFYTAPNTIYWHNNASTTYANVAVGSAITAWYTTDGQKQIVNRVNVLPAPVTTAVPVPKTIVAPVPQTVVVPVPQTVVVPAAITPPAVPLEPTGISPTNFYKPTAFYEGEVVRVSPDRIVMRTTTAPELVVYVNPQTTYRIGDRVVRLTDLSPGTPVRVDYIVQDNRPYARGILGRLRNP